MADCGWLSWGLFIRELLPRLAATLVGFVYKMPEEQVEKQKELKDLGSEGEVITGEIDGEGNEVKDDEVLQEKKKEEPYDAMRNEPHLVNLIVDSYTGDKDDRSFFHGVGTAYFYGGHVYTGSFANGFMCGRGKYVWSGGIIYEGDFTDNKVEGRGKYSWPDGSTYEGDVLNGLRHGQGAYCCASIPSVYNGEWRYGQRNGRGILKYEEEGLSYYDGHWLGNKRHGYGVRHYKSGNVYEGDWKSNVRHGTGTMHWYDKNEQYDGQWESGVQNGQGEHSWFLKRVAGSQYPLRNHYAGEWSNGKRHGHGTFYYASGAKYVGEWMNNMKHGHGRYVFKNGMVFEGTFELDHMLDFPELNPSGMATPDITSSGIPLQVQNPWRSATPIQPSQDTGSMSRNPLSLNVEPLLDERELELYKHEEELQAVTHVMLRHVSKLKQIYNFYSSLGHESSLDNTFAMTQLQFWRFVKDCKIHHLGVTLVEMDRFLGAEVSSDLRKPQHEVLVRDFLNAIVNIAYNLFKEEHQGEGPMVAWCVSKLINENILNNACTINGSLYADPSKAVEASKYMSKCWDVFVNHCVPNIHPPHEPTFKARQFLHLLNDFKLVNTVLTAKQVIEILAQDNPEVAPGDFFNLELEMTFLEFFEGLLDCASVFVTDTVLKGQASPKLSPEQSFHSRSAASFTPSTSKPGADSPEEGGEPDQGTVSVSETPAGRVESADRVSRVTSGSPEHKAQSAETPSKIQEGGGAYVSCSGKSPDPTQPSSQEGTKRVQSVQSGTNVTRQSACVTVVEDGNGNFEENSPTPEDQQQDEVDLTLERDQFQYWSLQLCVFFEKFFKAANHLEVVKRTQQKN